MHTTIERVRGPAARRFTYDEYVQLAETGLFRDQRVELLGGRIMLMSAQTHEHFAGVSLVSRVLTDVFGDEYWVRTQGPLLIAEASVPEPGVAVVGGRERDYNHTGHPTTAVLIVEVSDTSLSYDRRHKGGAYAKCGIADYWILNLPKQQLEVYRTPVADLTRPFGYRYAERVILLRGQAASPLVLPSVQVAVTDLLP